jgi:hypothetical protein
MTTYIMKAAEVLYETPAWIRNLLNNYVKRVVCQVAAGTKVWRHDRASSRIFTRFIEEKGRGVGRGQSRFSTSLSTGENGFASRHRLRN